ncbi:MAG: chromate transporter [Clostridia bacterium]|nr:chromate transporter [Clostridia bacterium]
MKLPIKENLKRGLNLFLTFFRIVAFTFGGGYDMVGLIHKEMVEKKKWIEDEEMLDVIAIAESTPGVIALNTATYVGAKVAGVLGAFVASFAVMLPSIIIISLISLAIEEFGNNKYVKWAFLGIRSAVAALILNAAIKLSKNNEKSIVCYCVMGVALVLAVLSTFEIIKLDMVFIILGAALFGIIWGIATMKKPKKEDAPPAETIKNAEEDASKESENKEVE